MDLDKSQMRVGASNIMRIPNMVLQPKSAVAQATTISQAIKITFPAGKGIVFGLRAGILKAQTRDFEKAGMTSLSLRLQMQKPDGMRDLVIAGASEGYAVFDSLSTWQRLENIPVDSNTQWTAYVQNEDDSTSANAGYWPWLELAYCSRND